MPLTVDRPTHAGTRVAASKSLPLYAVFHPATGQIGLPQTNADTCIAECKARGPGYEVIAFHRVWPEFKP